MTNNVYFKNLEGIVKESYAGGETPRWDWNTAIDIFNAKYKITSGMETGDIVSQRSAFLQYVGTRKFDKDGKEIA